MVNGRYAMSIQRGLLLVAAILCFGLAGCGGDGREAVVVYSPHGRDLLEAMEDAFEKAHPDLDMRWLDMGSQEVLERIRSERANPQADVWFGGPSVLFARAAADGYLTPATVSWASAVPSALRPASGMHLPLYLTPTFIVYNASAFSADPSLGEPPADWDDLLEPQWRDRILIRDPLASGTMRTLFGFVLTRGLERGMELEESVEAGFQWLLQLDGQTKEYVPSPALLHEKIIRQEGLLTLWEMTDILTLRSKEAPLAYRFPTSGAPVIEDSVALIEGAKHPEAARRLMEWLGSEEALLLAASVFRLPAVEGVDGLPGWVDDVRADLRAAPMRWDLLEEHGAEWMARWDREIRARGSAR